MSKSTVDVISSCGRLCNSYDLKVSVIVHFYEQTHTHEWIRLLDDRSFIESPALDWWLTKWTREVSLFDYLTHKWGRWIQRFPN